MRSACTPPVYRWKPVTAAAALVLPAPKVGTLTTMAVFCGMRARAAETPRRAAGHQRHTGWNRDIEAHRIREPVMVMVIIDAAVAPPPVMVKPVM